MVLIEVLVSAGICYFLANTALLTVVGRRTLKEYKDQKKLDQKSEDGESDTSKSPDVYSPPIKYHFIK